MRVCAWLCGTKDSVHNGADLVRWSFIDAAEFKKTAFSDARDFPFH